jgi:hypothetical protein
MQIRFQFARAMPMVLFVLYGCGDGSAVRSSVAPEGGAPAVQRDGGPTQAVYPATEHPLYDGHFVVSATRVYQAGTLSDTPPWDHMGDAATNLRPVAGTIEFDVDERSNTGTFRAALDLPEGRYVVEMDRFEQFSPCQDGGIAAWLFEHGDSGCGDTNWPKSILYVAGWGWGSATLNGRPLHTEYQIHFMVTQGMRDRMTLQVLTDRTGVSGAGAVNPAAMQLDFYIRSPESDERNRPSREVFDHFFAMEVTWK